MHSAPRPLITRVSLASTSGVEVSCALMKSISAWLIRASANAIFIARAGCWPVGSGSLICSASEETP